MQGAGIQPQVSGADSSAEDGRPPPVALASFSSSSAPSSSTLMPMSTTTPIVTATLTSSSSTQSMECPAPFSAAEVEALKGMAIAQAEPQRCPNCEHLQQKFLRLQQREQGAKLRRRRWMEEQKELVQRWEQAHCERSHAAAVEAELALTQERLRTAQQECAAQSSRILELELRLKRAEARLAEAYRAGTSGHLPPSPSADGAENLIYEHEQVQARIEQYLRQQCSTGDPYEETAGRDRPRETHTHDRRELFSFCSDQCAPYLEQLISEVDGYQKEVLQYQQLLQQQQEHHAITMKAVNEKYNSLKTTYRMTQQQVTALVFQLQSLSNCRPVAILMGVPLLPGSAAESLAADSAAGPAPSTVAVSTLPPNPQHNFG
eukprot:RCo038277